MNIYLFQPNTIKSNQIYILILTFIEVISGSQVEISVEELDSLLQIMPDTGVIVAEVAVCKPLLLAEAVLELVSFEPSQPLRHVVQDLGRVQVVVAQDVDVVVLAEQGSFLAPSVLRSVHRYWQFHTVHVG